MSLNKAVTREQVYGEYGLYKYRLPYKTRNLGQNSLNENISVRSENISVRSLKLKSIRDPNELRVMFQPDIDKYWGKSTFQNVLKRERRMSYVFRQ
jgi:hypothetical protein